MATIRTVVLPTSYVIGRLSPKCPPPRVLSALTKTLRSPHSAQLLTYARSFSLSCGQKLAEAKEQSQETHGPETPKVTEPVEEHKLKERFIPITRHSLVRHLMQENNFLNDDEKRKFESFALSLDTAVVNRYHNLLEEMKVLFDPINPDKDTMRTRRWHRRERLDNEFWLLQKMGNIMEKANFHELPRSEVERALGEHSAREGVMVSVDMNKYDVLRIWALGKDVPAESMPFYRKLFYIITRKPAPKPVEFYKRAVVAMRLKTDDKLMLKAFKEVPVNALEQLLPNGQIVMSKLDRGIITGSVALASMGVLAKLVSYLAHVTVDWTLLLTVVTGTLGIRAWTVYKNRRSAYLLEITRMLYFKNIANNRGLLALLVDRAEDELFKEMLLTFTFLLTARPPSVAEMPMDQQLPEQLGGLSLTVLEKKIEEWVYQKTGEHIHLDALESVELLTSYGIASEDYDKNVFVLPLEAARRNLPQARSRHELLPREQEYEAVEGYEYQERDAFEETEEEYKQEAKRRRKFGWF